MLVYVRNEKQKQSKRKKNLMCHSIKMTYVFIKLKNWESCMNCLNWTGLSNISISIYILEYHFCSGYKLIFQVKRFIAFKWVASPNLS